MWRARVTGAIVRAVPGAALAALFARAGRTGAAIAIGAMAGAIAIASLAAPGALRAAEDAIGRVVSAVVLTIGFCAVFVPARLMRRVRGEDPLRLRGPARATYWIPSEPDEEKRRYVRAMFAAESPRAGARRPILRLALYACAFAAMLEIALRFYGFGHPVLYATDALVGYYPSPGQDLARYGGRVSINGFGMRRPEFDRDKPRGAFRVLMLGDSTLYGGSYVDQDDLYARRLERALRASTGRDVEILNMGVNAWGPFHESGYVEKFGTFGADLAIVCLPIGDVFRPRYGLMELPMFSVESPPRLALVEVAVHVAWRVHASYTVPSDESVEQQSIAGMREYQRLASELASRGAEVMIEILPSRDVGTIRAAEPDALAVSLRRDLEERGYLVGYPVGVFAALPDPQAAYHDFTHLTRDGHAAYATYLESRVGESRRFRAWTASKP
jgi:hypothetical protein